MAQMNMDLMVTFPCFQEAIHVFSHVTSVIVPTGLKDLYSVTCALNVESPLNLLVPFVPIEHIRPVVSVNICCDTRAMHLQIRPGPSRGSESFFLYSF